MNLPAVLAVPVSRRLATLADMHERLSLEDAFDLLEIVAVDAHNERRWAEFERERSRAAI